MFFWKMEALKRELSEGPSTRRTMIYLVAVAVGPILAETAITLASFALLGFVETVPEIDVAEVQSSVRRMFTIVLLDLFLALVVVAGLLFCYRRNGGAQGRDFMDRLLPLTWVCAIRVHVVWALPILLAVSIVVTVFDSLDPPPDLWISAIASPIMVGLTLWRAGVHIRDVADGSVKS